MNVERHQRIQSSCPGCRSPIGPGRSGSPGVHPTAVGESAVDQHPIQDRGMRLTDIPTSEWASTVEARPRPVAELTAPSARQRIATASVPRPLGNPSAAHATVSVRIVLTEPRPTKYRKLRRACSFFGGSLIGISTFLPIFELDAGEGGGALVLLGSLSLAVAGIAIHLRSANDTNGVPDGPEARKEIPHESV